jgi:hypothetical protein
MMDRLSDEELDELERLEREASAAPWSAGRMDAVSYSGNGEGPFKNVYNDDPREGFHLGELVPYVVARGEGDEDECRSNAALIAAARNALPRLLATVRAAERLAEAVALEHDIGNPRCNLCIALTAYQTATKGE